MTKFWKIWKYALGSFQDETTKDYDNIICIIRSLIFLQLIITNSFIIAGNIRHWNDHYQPPKYETNTGNHRQNTRGNATH